MKHWYLVHTKPRQEKVAEYNLERQGYEVYLPLTQQPKRRNGHWTSVIEPLFPRYLFVRLQLGLEDFYPIRSTIGVRNLVRFAEEPAIVPDEIIVTLRHAADRATTLHRPHSKPFKQGDNVLIEEGPFAGLEGIFWVEKSQERVVILLEILGQRRHLTIKADSLKLA